MAATAHCTGRSLADGPLGIGRCAPGIGLGNLGGGTGLGITEVAFGKTSFPWFFRLFQFGLGRDYHDRFPESTAWRIEGAIKVLLGIGAAVVLIVASLP